MSKQKIQKPSINNEAAVAVNLDNSETISRSTATNRENAQRSTGPRTTEGRAIASQNATRHGLFSQRALIPGETPEEFQAFRNYHWNKLRPQGGLEDLLAEQFVITCWRLQRLERMEAQAFTRYGLSSAGEVMGEGYAMITSIESDNFFSNMGRYEAGFRRQYFRCLDTMHSLRRSGQFPYLPPPVLDVESVPPNPEPGPAVAVSPKPATVENTGGVPATAENHDLVTKVPSSES